VDGLTRSSVCIISILRLPSLKKASVSTDFTYDNIGIAVWSCVELNVAILCACLPPLKALLSHFFPGLLSRVKQTSRSDDMRYRSNSGLSMRETWNRTKLSNVEICVKNDAMGDSESRRGIVMVEDDVLFDSLELKARKDDTTGETQHSERTERSHKFSNVFPFQ